VGCARNKKLNPISGEKEKRGGFPRVSEDGRIGVKKCSAESGERRSLDPGTKQEGHGGEHGEKIKKPAAKMKT